MTGMIGMQETTRGVLRFAGTDARAVLQGVVTNNVDLVAPGSAVYSALLTPQGKYLCDFFLLDGGNGDVLIDVSVAQAPVLAQKLQMYGLRRDAKVSVEQGCEIALIWGGESETLTGEDIVADPRNPALGWRRYGPDAVGYLRGSGITEALASDRDALRITHLVPESGIELLPDDTYILEAGFERLSGVDFSKGCYVGQEVTARMKHKTSLRKGLVRVAVDGQAEAGTPIKANGKPAGTLFSQAGGAGLAHLRLDRAGEAMEAGSAKVTYVEGAPSV